MSLHFLSRSALSCSASNQRNNFSISSKAIAVDRAAIRIWFFKIDLFSKSRKIIICSISPSFPLVAHTLVGGRSLFLVYLIRLLWLMTDLIPPLSKPDSSRKRRKRSGAEKHRWGLPKWKTPAPHFSQWLRTFGCSRCSSRHTKTVRLRVGPCPTDLSCFRAGGTSP